MAKNNSTKAHSAPEQKVTLASQPATLDQNSKNSQRNFIFVCILLFAFVVAVFLPTLRNDFFYWYGDDTGYVTENAHVQSGLTLKSVKWAIGNIDIGNWHPLTWLSHMLDCQIYGLKPWGHHLTSVLLHALNALLLFIVLRRMTGAVWRSLAVALLFGLHPLRVESVAWVAERKDVLAAFFWMLTLWVYVRFAEESKAQSPKSKIFYTLALACFACGLMSKGIVVTLPFVLLLLDYWPLKRHEQKSAGKLLLEKVPFFGLAIAASAITYVAQKSWGFVQTVEKYPLDARLGNAVVSYGRYIGKMFWPVDLCGYYPHPGFWPATIVVIATIFLIGISVLAVVIRRKCAWLLMGWLWYLGTLVPVIGLVQLGDVAMADRYSYIPMVGILVPLVWGLHEWTKRWRPRIIVCSAVVAAVLVLCVAITEKQITCYKDSVTMWRHNFKVTGNIDVAQNALGLSLDKQGHTEEGIKELQAVLRSIPKRADIHYNLGTMLDKVRRVDDAISHYSEAVKLVPTYNDARLALGQNLLRKELTNAAIIQFEEMIKFNNDFRACLQLGPLMAMAGRLDEAMPFFERAVAEKPDAEAHMNLGRALKEKGQLDKAIHHFQEALKHDPNSTVARECLDYLNKAVGGARP